MKRKIISLLLAAFVAVASSAQTDLLNKKQKPSTFQKMETLQRSFSEERFGMFICYNIMSYGAKWGEANYPIDSFNPTNLDCTQWADAAVSAGMTYGLLTVKHHEGFCLWDSKTTEYDVAGTAYKKDVVKQFTEAFREKDLGVGLYYSMYDSTHDVDTGMMNKKTMEFAKQQLTELLTNYGPIDFLFFDGWYWRMGYREADYSEIRELIRKLQPNCLVADNNHIQGYYRNDYVMFEGPFGAYPPEDNTMASEICDRVVDGNGWFWSEESPKRACIDPQKTADKIIDLESRYCSFMLAVLPNRDGLIDENQLTCLDKIGKLWKPDTTRAPLPAQEPRVIYPIQPITATATSGNGELAIDGFMLGVDYTDWVTENQYPQSIILDLGTNYSGLEVLSCVPTHKMKPERSIKEGNVTKYKVYVSGDNQSFKKVAGGLWKADAKTKTAVFPATVARYIKFEIMEAKGAASIVELDVGSFSKPLQPIDDK